jgi:hypothetical protein
MKRMRVGDELVFFHGFERTLPGKCLSSPTWPCTNRFGEILPPQDPLVFLMPELMQRRGRVQVSCPYLCQKKSLFSRVLDVELGSGSWITINPLVTFTVSRKVPNFLWTKSTSNFLFDTYYTAVLIGVGRFGATLLMFDCALFC